jgi:hypothetical protein
VLDGVKDVKHTHEGRLYMDKAAGLDQRGSCARRTTAGTVTAAGVAAFDHDGRQHSKAIAEGVQVAHPVNPRMLETWNFSDAESLLCYPHMDQGLDLEAVAPQPPVAPERGRRGAVEAQYRNVLLPEHVEAVAEV